MRKGPFGTQQHFQIQQFLGIQPQFMNIIINIITVSSKHRTYS